MSRESAKNSATPGDGTPKKCTILVSIWLPVCREVTNLCIFGTYWGNLVEKFVFRSPSFCCWWSCSRCGCSLVFSWFFGGSFCYWFLLFQSVVVESCRPCRLPPSMSKKAGKSRGSAMICFHTWTINLLRFNRPLICGTLFPPFMLDSRQLCNCASHAPQRVYLCNPWIKKSVENRIRSHNTIVIHGSVPS